MTVSVRRNICELELVVHAVENKLAYKVQSLPDLYDSYFLEGPAQVVIQDIIRLTVCVYTRQSNLNPKSNTLDTDRRQHERPVACYRPAVFFRQLCLIELFPPHNEKLSTFFKRLFNLRDLETA